MNLPTGTPEKPLIEPAPLCYKHRYLLVHQCGYKPEDPWAALEIIATITLFQMATCTDRFHKRVDGDITRTKEVGCLACFHPEAFGQVVEAGKTKDFANIKKLGETWMAARAASKPEEKKP